MPRPNPLIHLQQVVSAQDAADKNRGLATLREVTASIGQLMPVGAPDPSTALAPQKIMTNMWKVSVAGADKVHVFVFAFVRTNPRTGNVINLKREQRVTP